VTWSPIVLRKLAFTSPTAPDAELEFDNGVNVVCGASETGKSFIAEAIDFALGAKPPLRDIPERLRYNVIRTTIENSKGESFRLSRSTTGGSTLLAGADNLEAETVLRESHAHDRADNLSGWLLSQISMLGRRVRRNKNGDTKSLSFRDFARLSVVEEQEIIKRTSPFLSGQYIGRTAELAVLKLMLTGADDSGLVPAATASTAGHAGQVEILDQLLAELNVEIEDIGDSPEELNDQLSRIDQSVSDSEAELNTLRENLDGRVAIRRESFAQRQRLSSRRLEIAELLARFELLSAHYQVDRARLESIKESGSFFVHLHAVSCPLCGASPDRQHMDSDCDGNVDAVIASADAEITKIDSLALELEETVADLLAEDVSLAGELDEVSTTYDEADKAIRDSLSINVGSAQVAFRALVEVRSSVQKKLDTFARQARLERMKNEIAGDTSPLDRNANSQVELSDSALDGLSQEVSRILNEWHFPGENRVHFDKQSADFVIDGKARGSRGKGLRAITHAATNLGLLEYCMKHDLPHPGFVVLDSPLLAYYKPEDDEDAHLQGSDLKERFYDYLVERHSDASQVIIIENERPTDRITSGINLTVFTKNPSLGRYGFFPVA